MAAAKTPCIEIEATWCALAASGEPGAADGVCGVSDLRATHPPAQLKDVCVELVFSADRAMVAMFEPRPKGKTAALCVGTPEDITRNAYVRFVYHFDLRKDALAWHHVGCDVHTAGVLAGGYPHPPNVVIRVASEVATVALAESGSGSG
jgi:hypothetical protein